MEHLYLLRDIFDLLNSYEIENTPEVAAMRQRINDYMTEQGYEIIYDAPEQVGLFKDGIKV